MTLRRILFLFLLAIGLQSNPCLAQFGASDPFTIEEDDLNIGGDIFSDFNEDIDSAQIMEDERFFRYGRFFSVSLSFGLTTFDGNRGTAYENDPPTFGLSVQYFSDFQTSFSLGMAFSKHHFYLDEEVNGFPGNGDDTPNGPGSGVGLVDVAHLRIHFGTRYYIDTTDLGTAITYSNPYVTGRIEYWYSVNKFRDQGGLVPDDAGGGLGIGVGGGLEFPIKLRETYIGLEFLWHSVNFHDKFTQNYRPVSWGTGFGYDDMTGSIYTLMVSYVVSW